MSKRTRGQVREIVSKWLISNGCAVDRRASANELARCVADVQGVSFIGDYASMAAAWKYLRRVARSIIDLNLIDEDSKVESGKNDRRDFYKSWEWRTLRMKVLKKHGQKCMLCGGTPGHTDMNGDNVRIVVDHIKPISKYWDLRLKETNLQVLCDECNQGKGNWDETDYR